MSYHLICLCWGRREKVLTAGEKAGTSNFQNYNVYNSLDFRELFSLPGLMPVKMTQWSWLGGVSLGKKGS